VQTGWNMSSAMVVECSQSHFKVSKTAGLP
jgi:hypothetical protein